MTTMTALTGMASVTLPTALPFGAGSGGTLLMARMGGPSRRFFRTLSMGARARFAFFGFGRRRLEGLFDLGEELAQHEGDLR
ncbi:MAG TPA: hypothetical protein VGM73_07550 [Candidatus Didemnitutus sp.]|jgi:hypothetical protein